jgi:hypothetical protein
MWKETRTTKKQLNRLKKYKAWLENETTMEFDLAIDLYKVILYSIQNEAIVEASKKILNKIETHYQNNLLNK